MNGYLLFMLGMVAGAILAIIVQETGRAAGKMINSKLKREPIVPGDRWLQKNGSGHPIYSKIHIYVRIKKHEKVVRFNLDGCSLEDECMNEESFINNFSPIESDLQKYFKAHDHTEDPIQLEYDPIVMNLCDLCSKKLNKTILPRYGNCMILGYCYNCNKYRFIVYTELTRLPRSEPEAGT